MCGRGPRAEPRPAATARVPARRPARATSVPPSHGPQSDARELIDQVLRPDHAKPRELLFPRVPDFLDRSPGLERRTQFRPRRETIEALGAELEFHQMDRVNRGE